ncbi:MAG: orotate phosphoribosyltransferase [Chloroflexi bacterium]|nr:orotate phosphoribosyltransferase [Chloroflexota bacterium]
MSNVEELFVRSGAVLKGHFLLTSGLHSPVYWEKFQVLQFPRYTGQLCGLMAGHFRDKGIEVVAGPTTGGVVLAFETARQLDVRAIFAEKAEGGGRVFRRGFSVRPGERVLVVDDILTTGGSVREVVEAVTRLGGQLAGVAVLVDRAEHHIDFGVPLFACHRSETVTYRPEACPLCAAGLPLTRPGG